MILVFSVTELNARIRERLTTDARLHNLWARGELSNVTNHRSGHRYFTLKDRESNLSCVLFKRYSSGLDFQLKDGQNVLVFGDIDVYRPQGKVQLQARAIKLDSGLGARHQEFEMLKQKLGKEGLFDSDRKKKVPSFPDRIGIVTSSDGAALRDVVRTIGAYPARIVISPTQVQGEGAASSIVSGIRSLHGKADVMIVCRGGGSAEDLWPFNDERVARAIFESEVPVVSAVGHETDVTIADFVADVRAATPTAAAKLVIPDISETQLKINQMRPRMVAALRAHLERENRRLDYLEMAISSRRMYGLVGEMRQRLDYSAERLFSAEQGIIEQLEKRLELSEGKLSSVSPLATLSRGYAIARSKDRLLLRAEDAKPGEIIEVIFVNGSLRCKVISKDVED